MAEDLLTHSWFEPFGGYWNQATRAGYSGVATLVRDTYETLSAAKGIGDEKLDAEGRVLATEHPQFVLVNAYAPHSHRKLLRLDEKLRFGACFLKFITELRAKGKPVIIVGDLNVALEERDLANPVANKKNAGFLPAERDWLRAVICTGFVDAFRSFSSDGGQYTWWSMRAGVRERNVGWRLDYILVDTRIATCLTACFHSPLALGSDHCPVTADLSFRDMKTNLSE